MDGYFIIGFPITLFASNRVYLSSYYLRMNDNPLSIEGRYQIWLKFPKHPILNGFENEIWCFENNSSVLEN